MTVLVVAVLIAAEGDGDGNGQAVASPTSAAPSSASPTPSATTPPTPTAAEPSPAPGGDPFVAFAPEPETGNFQYVSLDPSQMAEDTFGIWFMDAETGQVSGWTSEVSGEPYGFSGDNRFVAFRRREQQFREGVTYPAGFVIADRDSGTAYRLPEGVEPVRENTSGQSLYAFRLASREGRVLVRAEDRFAVYDFDIEEVVATFQAHGSWGVFSDDGSRVAVFGDGLSIVEVMSGELRVVETNVTGNGPSLQNGLAGEAVLLTTDNAWASYTWEGELLAEGSGSVETYAAPSGDILALAEPLVEIADPPAQPWFRFSAVDTQTGEPVFRVVGVITAYGYTTGNRWLADGSGIGVMDPSFSIATAMLDGSFKPYVGIPSPVSTDRFAVGSPVEGGPAVLDLEGNLIVSAMPPGRSQSFVPPWGATGDEIRFITPHGGHGGIGYALSLVVPYVELPPYQEATQIQLRQESLGADLLDEAAGTTIVGTLAETRVALEEAAYRRLEPSDPAYVRHCDLMNQLSNQPPGTECRGVIVGLWAKVTTGGQEGWLLTQVSPEGA